mmetsp:Transcript_98553/g.279288  ORF Transcript_98553/g.279288 Transcript_98553/m.279288 type:complete len:240 (-) Transcript_98553:295-1014(-)
MQHRQLLVSESEAETVQDARELVLVDVVDHRAVGCAEGVHEVHGLDAALPHPRGDDGRELAGLRHLPGLLQRLDSPDGGGRLRPERLVDGVAEAPVAERAVPRAVPVVELVDLVGVQVEVEGRHRHPQLVEAAGASPQPVHLLEGLAQAQSARGDSLLQPDQGVGARPAQVLLAVARDAPQPHARGVGARGPPLGRRRRRRPARRLGLPQVVGEHGRLRAAGPVQLRLGLFAARPARAG